LVFGKTDQYNDGDGQWFITIIFIKLDKKYKTTQSIPLEEK
jgi:hypothetical protein